MADSGATERPLVPGQWPRLAAIEEFVRSLQESRTDWAGGERRQAVRYPYVAAVEVMRVDPVSHVPCLAEAVHVVARDISTSGIAIVHRGHPNCKQLAVRLTRSDGRSILVLTQVVRVRPIGHNHYEVAGMFVEKIV